MNKNRNKKICRSILSALLLIILVPAVLLEYLTLTEYRPGQNEPAAADQANWEPLSRGDTIKVLTWNCGYGALGDNADFFMDGGKGVVTADRERVQQNLDGIVKATRQMDPDVILYQEVDMDAARSHYIDESITLINGLLDTGGRSYCTAFADNLNVRFIPYPIPPIGRVRSGILSLTGFMTDSAERIQLPCPFRWPIRLANFKRCLLLERLPLQNSGKELVIINLHMDANDDGAGKKAQTQALFTIMREEAEKGNYVIAGGDFNQTFDSADIINEGWQFLMDDSVPSRRSLDRALAGADRETLRYYVVDGFIVSGNIEVRSLETKDLGFVCTDHNPVLMECTLK